MSQEPELGCQVKIEEDDENSVPYEVSEASSFSIFHTPPNERKRNSLVSGRRKCLEDTNTVGSSNHLVDQLPELDIDVIPGDRRNGKRSKTYSMNLPSPTMSASSSTIRTITGVYPSYSIEEEQEDTVVFGTRESVVRNIFSTPQPKSFMLKRTHEETRPINLPCKDVIDTPVSLDLNFPETPILTKSQTHLPNYLRSTLSSANKAMSTSVCVRTAQGSPANNPKPKTPKSRNVLETSTTVAPVVKKMDLIGPMIMETIGRNNENVEKLISEDDEVVFVEEKRKATKESKSTSNSLILLTRKIKRSHVSGRPVRSRIKPLRSWLGERAVYSVDEKGFQTLEKTRCAQLKDKKLCRYIMVSEFSNTMVEEDSEYSMIISSSNASDVSYIPDENETDSSSMISSSTTDSEISYVSVEEPVERRFQKKSTSKRKYKSHRISIVIEPPELVTPNGKFDVLQIPGKKNVTSRTT